jgi:hypothetical protein
MRPGTVRYLSHLNDVILTFVQLYLYFRPYHDIIPLNYHRSDDYSQNYMLLSLWHLFRSLH